MAAAAGDDGDELIAAAPAGRHSPSSSSSSGEHGGVASLVQATNPARPAPVSPSSCSSSEHDDDDEGEEGVMADDGRGDDSDLDGHGAPRRRSLVFFESVPETLVVAGGDAGGDADACSPTRVEAPGDALDEAAAGELPAAGVLDTVVDELPLGSTNVNELPPRQYLRELVARGRLGERDLAGAAALLLVHEDATAARDLLATVADSGAAPDRQHAMYNLATALMVLGDYNGAIDYFKEATAAYASLHDSHGRLLATVNTAACLMHQERYSAVIDVLVPYLQVETSKKKEEEQEEEQEGEGEGEKTERERERERERGGGAGERWMDVGGSDRMAKASLRRCLLHVSPLFE